jgi:CheY-like chemotaxis protein
MVQSSAESLLEIINEILDYSKIEAHKLELIAEPFVLASHLNSAIGSVSVAAQQKKLELKLQMSAGVPEVVIGDRGRLRQILVNLVGNAIKFTDRGRVVVRVQPVAVAGEVAIVQFSVCDTGIGIPPESHRTIFSPFEQADKSSTRRFGGTGLGLSITARLVELMGGKIWLESQVGFGSRFHFTARFGLQKEATLNGATAAATVPAPKASIRPLRILLAEDNRINQRLVMRILEKSGHHVLTADNGRQALQLWRDQAVDLLLLDVKMPELDGFAVAREIRRQEQGARHLPIIAITANALAGDCERCLGAGMDDYVPKPIRIGDLHRAIARLATQKSSALTGVTD